MSLDNQKKGGHVTPNAAGHEDLHSASNRMVNWQQTLRLFRQTDAFTTDSRGNQVSSDRTALQHALTPARKLELDAEQEKRSHMVINGESPCEPSRLVQCYNRFLGVDHMKGGGSYFDYAQTLREERAAEWKAAGKLPDVDDDVVRMPTVTECSDTLMGLGAVFGAIDDIRADSKQRIEREKMREVRAELAKADRKMENARLLQQQATQDGELAGDKPMFGRR
jgi:hypothetical protein